MTKVFIDGSAGTTGLRIHERLAVRRDIELLSLPEELRKDPAARKEMLNRADIAFLCLPDAAAVESVSLVENPDTVVIDTSTAHRTALGWTYGFPELRGQREKIAAAKRIANPGCHASGFIALVAPLVAAGLISPGASLSATSLTGYSGGGKSMIADYENAERSALLDAPRMYGITQKHKHLPEMRAVCGLEHEPVFLPIVAPYYAGMEVAVPLTAEQSGGSVEALAQAYAAYYGEGLVKYVPSMDEKSFISACTMAGRDDMLVSVVGNDERMVLVSLFDNLGKGASGAAIQNMNIVLGLPENTGLTVG